MNEMDFFPVQNVSGEHGNVLGDVTHVSRQPNNTAEATYEVPFL